MFISHSLKHNQTSNQSIINSIISDYILYYSINVYIKEIKMAHSDDATKVLEQAVPTANSDGDVTSWNITYSYEKNSYKTEFSADVLQVEEDGTENFTLQAPGDFTQAELIALLPISVWNDAYTSQYESVNPAEAAAVETTDNDFDVSTLAAS